MTTIANRRAEHSSNRPPVRRSRAFHVERQADTICAPMAAGEDAREWFRAKVDDGLAVHRRVWRPWVLLDRRIHRVVQCRLRYGRTETLDKRLVTLIRECERVDRAGWSS